MSLAFSEEINIKLDKPINLYLKCVRSLYQVLFINFAIMNEIPTLGTKIHVSLVFRIKEESFDRLKVHLDR